MELAFLKGIIASTNKLIEILEKRFIFIIIESQIENFIYFL
jgi:hypothetical protein